MDDPLRQLTTLVNAEDYLDFFGIAYDPQVVHVNRLHILKKFGLLKGDIDRDHGQRPLEGRLSLYREAMQKAYEIFLTSGAPEQRLFKVFQQPPPGLIQITFDRK
jgi:nitrogenase-stabilizing/protective protein